MTVSLHLLTMALRYNIDNVGTEGGLPTVHPAFASGQDGFLASLASKGKRLGRWIPAKKQTMVLRDAA